MGGGNHSDCRWRICNCGACEEVEGEEMKLTLRRERTTHPDCTLGVLEVGTLSLSTIERPWVPSATSKGGTKGVSCVPPGIYQLVRHNTEAHPMTWALVNRDLDVAHLPSPSDGPGVRTAVLLHPANWAHELRGCIAPGTRTTTDGEGRFMVAESKRAMRMLQAVVPWVDGHTLEIVT
jgi:hypothetical protein